MYLGLDTSCISGTVPQQLASLTALTRLSLYTNSISGTLPRHLVSLTALLQLDMHNNSISGTLQKELFVNMSGLRQLSLQVNRLSSSLPLVFSTNLEVLLVHRNRFSGRAPSFERFTHLEHLSVFSNNLEGRLILPTNVSLSSVLAFSNR